MLHHDILNNLKKTALKSPVKSRHSALLIKKNMILKPFYNKFTRCVILDDEKKFYFTIHAEIQAMQFFKNVSGFDLVVIRLSRDGTHFTNSRPCNDCILKMRQLGIRKVFYSNENSEIICKNVNEMDLIHVCSAVKNYLITNKKK
jgi:deoxycytidylate deaminase